MNLSLLRLQHFFFFSGYHQQTYLHYVYDSVLAFAHALTNLQHDLCGDDHENCDGMQPERIDGATLLRHLENVSFLGIVSNSHRLAVEL